MIAIAKRISAAALAIGLSFIMLIGMSLPVQAQESLEDLLSDVGSESDLTQEPLTDTIGTLISIFVSVLGIVLLIIIIYAGYLWMTAGGNPDQVGTAKSWMINAIIGLIVLLAAYSISFFVINALTEAGLTTS